MSHMRTSKKAEVTVLCTTYCGRTAFQFHRIPPQVKCLLPPFPDVTTQSGKWNYPSSGNIFENITLPLTALVTSRPERRNGKTVRTTLWTGELPAEAFWEDESLGIRYASPLFILLTMAPSVSTVHLAMAAFEFCGAFSIFHPSTELQRHLDRLSNQRLIWPGGWKQVRDSQRKPTSLWKRDPLIELKDLHAFVQKTEGMRGHKKLAHAARLVTGIAYSPFEVQASILLGAPRTQGGEGFGPFINNQRIALTQQAAKLAGQSTCYADIFFGGTEKHQDIDIECHGHMIHDGGAKAGLDANRTLALQSMGIEVMLLTSEQLYNPQRFEAFVNYLADTLCVHQRPKTDAMKNRKRELYTQLFIDWETLGEPSRQR